MKFYFVGHSHLDEFFQLFENLSWNNIDLVTLLHVKVVESLIPKSNCDKDKTFFSVKGFTEDFNIIYKGTEMRCLIISLRVGSPTDLLNN